MIWNRSGKRLTWHIFTRVLANANIRLSVYDKLKANPEEHPAVLTEKPFMPNKIRESMAELFFEKFNVPSMYFGLSAVFSMYALGTITGGSRYYLVSAKGLI